MATKELFDAATVPDLPQDMISLLEAGAPALNRLREYNDTVRLFKGGG